MKQRKFTGLILYILLMAGLLALISSLSGSRSQTDLPYSTIVRLFREEQVESFAVKDNVIHLSLHSPLNGAIDLHAPLASPETFREELGELFEQQNEAGILTSYTFYPDSKPSLIEKILPYVLIGAALILMLYLFTLRAGGGAGPGANFAKARITSGEQQSVTFADVAGADEEKEELCEVVEFLRTPDRFTSLGAKIPKGVLLAGPPGTGKTLLARAVAGEAGVPFLAISGSDFMELYVGVGASRVRDLFEQAKKVAPAIIFIDEIDAIGRRRGAGMGGGHDEREQTLNQLLVEMDGFTANQNVIVIAATNRKDILDPALLRPGRFDRHIYVDRPDAVGREAILKVHARNKRLSDDVSLQEVAMATSGFTGADLANLLNEAAILAARRELPAVNRALIDEAMMKMIAGPEKRSRKQLEQDRKITAIHEAGHAVAAFFLPSQDPVHQITIIPRGNSLGMTISLPEHDAAHHSRNQMFEKIIMCLGGRVAEALFLQDISGGAVEDIRRASSIARDMVARYGMSEKIGAVSYSSDEEIFVGRDYEKTKTYSEQTAGLIDQEVKAIIDRAYAKCVSLLEANSERLHEVADFLLKYDTMSRQQFTDCMEGRPVSTPRAE